MRAARFSSFLGSVDLYGTTYLENMLATGFGMHMAVPLLRKNWRPDLEEADARKLLEDCMRVLYYRDARTINKVRSFSTIRSFSCLVLFRTSTPRHVEARYSEFPSTACSHIPLAQFQVGLVTAAGIQVGAPYSLETEWSLQLFQRPAGI